MGGQIFTAAKAPYGDEELFGMIDFLTTQCKKAEVEFHMGIRVTSEMIDEEMPDVVVVATGAKFLPEKIPGYDRSNVVSVLEVLDGKVDTGQKIIVWGGKKPGIAAALHLAKAGKKVAIVSQERKVGSDVNPSYVWRYIKKLRDHKVTTYRDCTIEEITDNGAIIKALHGVRIPVVANTIVYAEREPVSYLKDKANELRIEVHVVGDALVPRALSNALHDGYRTGIRI